MLANQMSEINVSFMTIGFNTPAQKHIILRRLNEEVNRPDRVTDAHVHAVHAVLRRRYVLKENWLHNKSSGNYESECLFVSGCWMCTRVFSVLYVYVGLVVACNEAVDI